MLANTKHAKSTTETTRKLKQKSTKPTPQNRHYTTPFLFLQQKPKNSIAVGFSERNRPQNPCDSARSKRNSTTSPACARPLGPSRPSERMDAQSIPLWSVRGVLFCFLEKVFSFRDHFLSCFFCFLGFFLGKSKVLFGAFEVFYYLFGMLLVFKCCFVLLGYGLFSG